MSVNVTAMRNELEKLVGLSQSALSQHLSRLHHEKIVEHRREGESVNTGQVCLLIN